MVNYGTLLLKHLIRALKIFIKLKQNLQLDSLQSILNIPRKLAFSAGMYSELFSELSSKNFAKSYILNV